MWLGEKSKSVVLQSKLFRNWSFSTPADSSPNIISNFVLRSQSFPICYSSLWLCSTISHSFLSLDSFLSCLGFTSASNIYLSFCVRNVLRSPIPLLPQVPPTHTHTTVFFIPSAFYFLCPHTTHTQGPLPNFMVSLFMSRVIIGSKQPEKERFYLSYNSHSIKGNNSRKLEAGT